MIRVLMIALLLCCGTCRLRRTIRRPITAGRRKIPPDYHGVPTDNRPPSMVPAPVAQ